MRVICDNMLIYTENNDKFPHDKGAILYPNLIWNHEKEFFICLRPTTAATDKCSHSHPIEVSIVPYENIQYFEAYSTTKDAVNMVNTKDQFASVTEEHKQVIMDMISRKTI